MCGLTCVDLLQGDVLLQLPPQSDLGAVLAASAVVGQDEVRVAAVQRRQLAEWVGHGLVRPGHLRETHDTGPHQTSLDTLLYQQV